MEFGARVIVTRTIVRVLTDRKEHFEDQPADTIEHTTGFKLQRSVGYRPLYRGVLGHRRRDRYFQPEPLTPEGWNEWPGLGIPEADAPTPRHAGTTPKPYDLEPDGLNFVRFRRVQTISASRGITIGAVTMYEGRVHEGGSGGYDADPEPAYFAQQRTLRLVEVALHTAHKAVIVLAWPPDLTVVDANATMTPHGAART